MSEADVNSLFDKYEDIVSGYINKKRMRHSKGVAYLAYCLGIHYGCNANELLIAGLVHDIAKGYSDEELLIRCEAERIDISDIERKNPQLLHAKYGAFMCRNVLNIESEDIFRAVRNHTTGRPGMSLFETIIFLSDYIEPHRTQLSEDEMNAIRALAFKDIYAAAEKVAGLTISYLKSTSNSEVIDETTLNTYNWLKEITSHEH